jgi:hypothetical protein
MPSKVQLKRSAVPGKVPTTAQIDLAELAVNTRDGKLYMKRDNGNGTFTIIEVGAVVSVAGKVGAVTLAKADVGLGNVDNTSDAAKPVSTAQQTALNAKANTTDVNTALAGKVDTTRQVATGTGLTGGGALSANRTLAADIATGTEAEAGAAAGKLMDALRVEQHMLANALGWGQTWQSPARAANTIYTNGTSRPIMVSLGLSSATARYVQVSPDGLSWFNVGYTLSLYAAAQFVVPVGWRYRINGSGTVGWWSELR